VAGSVHTTDHLRDHAAPGRARAPRSKAASTTPTGSTPARHDAPALLGRYAAQFTPALRRLLADTAARAAAGSDAILQPELATFYGQMEYHLGWREADFTPVEAHPGKLLRPALVLLGCELAVGTSGGDRAARADAVTRALPAAAAVELVHNFSLIHDDIEDRDEVRRHRPTVWRLWGQPQAINTGDGMFALARLALFGLRDTATDPALVCDLAALLDRTSLRLCEGQHLDMSYEGRHDVTVAMYLAMIERKTAALMACALEMGARLGGAAEPLAARLGACGLALGLGFQLRDDLLGIWAASRVLGKTDAGDLRRKKMSLPVIHALEHAGPDDRADLLAIYSAAGPATDDQIARALAILDHTGARARIRDALRDQCARARAALDEAADEAPGAREPRDLLAALVDFIAAEAE
jgi:geranylgeranyl diphosphate synthase type I